jgi:dihydrofolate reductase
MIQSIIVAASENNVIGVNNQLPWHLPADLKYFKNTTWALPILMGRKTYESIGKPLPGRHNIVMSRNKGFKAQGISVVASIEEAHALVNQDEAKELFIIGGAELFKSTMAGCNRIYLTRVHTHIEGDVFFPELSDHIWLKVWNKKVRADEKNLYDVSFQVWERINS